MKMFFKIIREQAQLIQKLEKENDFINKCYYKFQKKTMKELDKFEKRIKKLEELKKEVEK